MAQRRRLHIHVDVPHSLHNDWTFDNPKRVTMGFDPRASVWLLDADAGAKREIFFEKRNEICLRVGDALIGDLVLGQEKISIGALRDNGVLRSDSKGEFVVLKQKTSGILRLGSTSVRFWFHPAPQDPEFPSLPWPIRWVRSVPRLFVLVFLFSFVTHLWLERTLRLLPNLPEPSYEEVAHQFVRLSILQQDMADKKFGSMRNTRKIQRNSNLEKGESNVPSPNKPSAGFLSAVLKKQGAGNDLLFSTLFSSDRFGKNLGKALSQKSLNEVLQESAGRNVNSFKVPDAKTTDIGILSTQSTVAKGFQRNVSGPEISRLSMDAPQIQGKLGQEEVKNVAAIHAEQLRDCYEAALTRSASHSGKVVLGFVIDPDGTPRNIKVIESSISDVPFRQCLVDRVLSWRFPKPEGGPTPVKFPFIFSAGSKG